MSPLRIVMLGPPGAGKGTQSILFSKANNIPHISTGEIMRGAVKNGGKLGKQLKQYLDAGNLVPDDLVTELVKERLSESDCSNGFLLDGYPRTLIQAQTLDNLLKSLNRQLTHVIDLKVAESILLERIRLRGEGGAGRSDDNMEVASNRLRVYWEQTAPVTHYYSTKGDILKTVDGLGTVDEVQRRIANAVM